MVKEENEDLKELVKVATPLVKIISPAMLKYQENNLPVIRRWQWINFSIMISVLGIIAWLAYVKIIDGSAATGLIGAVIGYVFGHVYSQVKK